MKILQVIPSISKRYGGATVAVVEECLHLRQKGVNVTIATTHFKEEGPQTEKGLKIYSFESCLGEYKYSLDFKKWIKANARNYDLICINSVFCYSTVTAASAARKADVPYVVRPMGMLYEWSLRNKSYLLKLLYLALLERRTLEKASILNFTTEDEQRNIAINLKNKNNFIVPHGIDLKEPAGKKEIQELYPELREKNIILFLSRIHPKKGLDLIIPKLKGIFEQNKDWILVVAGSGESCHVKDLQEKTKALKLQNHVIFVGSVAGDKKEALLRAAKIFILPSYTENFGIAVMEAMAFKLPVIVSDQVGICPDIKRHTAGIVVPCAPKQVEEAILKLVGDSDLRRSMGENGRRLVEDKFQWSAITEKLIQEYMKILEQRQVNA